MLSCIAVIQSRCGLYCSHATKVCVVLQSCSEGVCFVLYCSQVSQGVCFVCCAVGSAKVCFIAVRSVKVCAVLQSGQPRCVLCVLYCSAVGQSGQWWCVLLQSCSRISQGMCCFIAVMQSVKVCCVLYCSHVTEGVLCYFAVMQSVKACVVLQSGQ